MTNNAAAVTGAGADGAAAAAEKSGVGAVFVEEMIDVVIFDANQIHERLFGGLHRLPQLVVLQLEGPQPIPKLLVAQVQLLFDRFLRTKARRRVAPMRNELEFTRQVEGGAGGWGWEWEEVVGEGGSRW